MLNLPQKFKNGFTGKAINVYPIVVINAGGNIIRLAQIKGFLMENITKTEILQYQALMKR